MLGWTPYLEHPGFRSRPMYETGSSVNIHNKSRNMFNYLFVLSKKELLLGKIFQNQ